MKTRKKNTKTPCANCGIIFEHFSWDGRKYCSKKCHYNKLKVTSTCMWCGRDFLVHRSRYKRSKGRMFCSRECYNEDNYTNTKKIKRSTKFIQDLLTKSMCECGVSKKYLLEIHHIDGNNSNNAKENMEIVCGNCHMKRHMKKNKLDEWIYHPKSLTPRDELPNL